MYVLFYIAFCFLLAEINAQLIKEGRRIYHAVNGLLHLLAWTLVFLATHNYFFLAMLPFIGRLFFDVALNLLRGLDIEYIPENPKSIIDRIEKKLFKDDWLTPKVIYVIIIGHLIGIYYATR